jgi:DNA repair exonuclease SbcCD ATPase subunit
MKPIKTTISGIGPHSGTTVLWADYASPIAICAPFGTGKTWLIEAVIAALYGRFAWYSGSIYDAMTQGGNGDAMIELTFDHAGERYIARRELKATSKTQAQTALLYKADKAVPIAGPKLKDFERAIESMLGDAETALATWFLSQNRYGDLCGQPGDKELQTRRRGVFNTLVGADRLDGYLTRVVDKAKSTQATVEELTAQLAGEADPGPEIERRGVELAQVRMALETARSSVEWAADRLETARKALRDAEGGNDVLLAQIAEYERAQKAVVDLEARAKALTTECETLKARAGVLEQARADVAELTRMEDNRSSLLRNQSSWVVWSTWEREHKRLVDSVGAALNLVNHLRGVPGLDRETVCLAGELHTLREQYRAAAEENARRGAVNAERDATGRKIASDLQQAENNLEQTRVRMARKPETPGGTVCASCPFLQEFQNLETVAAGYEKTAGDLREKLAAVPAIEPIEDLTALIQRGEQAKAAEKAVQDAQGQTVALAKAEAALSAAQDAASRHDAGKPPQAPDRSADLADCQREMDRLAGAGGRVRAAEQAAQDLTAKEMEYGAAVADKALAEAESDKTRATAESARATLQDSDAQRAGLRSAERQAAQEVQTARGQVEELTARLARTEEQIAEFRRRLQEQAAKRTRLAGLVQDLDALKDLRNCFGPRGVRQILMDAEVPALEAIADRLFDIATGGRQHLRIATQTVLKSGETAEAFDFLIRDGRGERDVLQHSGGELQLILIIFRLATALWVGQLRGVKADCLFLDEAFDRLGAEGTEDLLRILEHLSEQISLIVVVTHDPQIAGRLSSQIHLEKGLSGVRILERSAS